MSRARVNYLVDVGIGVAGLISAISGLVFLLPGDLGSGILGIGYQTWSTVHTWSSLVAIAGVGAHTALHWKWMVAMTRQMLPATSRQAAQEPATELAFDGAQGRPLNRRAFLALGGAAAAVSVAAVAGYKAVPGATPVEAIQSSNQLTTMEQEGGVACPFGLVNDPYPGRCRHYRDSDGNGICDYSVAGSGSNLSTSGDGSFEGGSSRHRAGFGRP